MRHDIKDGLYIINKPNLSPGNESLNDSLSSHFFGPRPGNRPLYIAAFWEKKIKC